MFDKLIGMAVLPASDQARARAFWHDVFGADPVRSDEGGDLYDLGGTPVFVYETQFAGTAQNTALGLVTADLDGDMAELRRRGVVFHEYDFPGLTTVDGVAELEGERSAWFSDSEGNIVSLMQPVPGDLDQLRAWTSAVAD
ncbi:VOC family protein [Agromyces seonyuensis]|uniref:VOC family protein n=1 Tax=Agromyces seonyuensis TaxID=2662446 RepID=A0A6I4P5M5_9MICO|nr:VOC family protein [Agromyces seonyuensis]MWC00366.1 VOC family protein [Agromyces seonyuensis]